MTAIDYAVVVFFLIAMLAIGGSFAYTRRRFDEYVLGGEASWLAIGGSLAATLAPFCVLVTAANDSYHIGLPWLGLPICFWLVFPLIAVGVAPLLARCGARSPLDYLRMRFGPAVAGWATALAFVWRGAFLILALAAAGAWLAARLLAPAPAWLVVLGIGGVCVACAWLGGRKAVAWSGAFQAVAALLALLVIFAAVVWRLDAERPGVIATADAYGRRGVTVVDLGLDPPSPDSGKPREIKTPSADWNAPWNSLGRWPLFALALAALLIADPVVAGRYVWPLAEDAPNRGLWLAGLLFTALIGLAVFAGVGLLAVYQQQRADLPPIWVVNVDPGARRSLTDPATRTAIGQTDDRSSGSKTSIVRLLPQDDQRLDPTSGRPLLPFDDGDELAPGTVTLEMAQRLVAEGRLLRPHTGEPVTDVREVYDPAEQSLRIHRLWTTRPLPRDVEGISPEVILHRRADDELLPWFVSRRMSFGSAGLAVTGLIAAIMAVFTAGVHGLATELTLTAQAKDSSLRRWLARRFGETPERLGEKPLASFAQGVTLLLGCLLTLAAVGAGFLRIGSFDSALWLLTLGGPLLALFLLGMCFKRAGAATAAVTLGAGIALTGPWMAIFALGAFAETHVAPAWLESLGPNYPPLIIFGVSLFAGFLTSRLEPKPPKSRVHGLTFGSPPLRHADDEEIDLDFPV